MRSRLEVVDEEMRRNASVANSVQKECEKGVRFDALSVLGMRNAGEGK